MSCSRKKTYAKTRVESLFVGIVALFAPIGFEIPFIFFALGSEGNATASDAFIFGILSFTIDHFIAAFLYWATLPEVTTGGRHKRAADATVRH